MLGIGEALRIGIRSETAMRRFVMAYGRGWKPPFRAEELDEVLRTPLADVFRAGANQSRKAGEEAEGGAGAE